MDCLTERTDAKRRQGYIAAASTEGKVTLLTKAFGRGIDFQMPDTHRLVVVPCFDAAPVTLKRRMTFLVGKETKHFDGPPLLSIWIHASNVDWFSFFQGSGEQG